MSERDLNLSALFMRVAGVVLLLHAVVATLMAQSHLDVKELLREMTLERGAQIPGKMHRFAIEL